MHGIMCDSQADRRVEIDSCKRRAKREFASRELSRPVVYDRESVVV
jgi:hypothetical protein